MKHKLSNEWYEFTRTFFFLHADFCTLVIIADLKWFPKSSSDVSGIFFHSACFCEQVVFNSKLKLTAL